MVYERFEADLRKEGNAFDNKIADWVRLALDTRGKDIPLVNRETTTDKTLAIRKNVVLNQELQERMKTVVSDFDDDIEIARSTGRSSFHHEKWGKFYDSLNAGEKSVVANALRRTEFAIINRDRQLLNIQSGVSHPVRQLYVIDLRNLQGQIRNGEITPTKAILFIADTFARPQVALQ